LKEAPVALSSDEFLDASVALLNNQALLTVFVRIVFSKTNIYDVVGMQAAFKLTTRWFNHLEQRGTPFPSNFDFTFYLKAMSVALGATDHSIVTTRVLWHVLRTLHYLPVEPRVQLAENLVKELFFDFFFHWSNNIRYLFNLVLLY
jgi:hypothetical protein